MDLDTQTLKECRLGPIVLFYTKTKRVTSAVNRQADALVQAWSRPIIKRPNDFRSRHVEQQSQGQELSIEEEEELRRAKRRGFDAQTAIRENEGRKAARLYLSKVSIGSLCVSVNDLLTLPQEIQYTVAPESRLQHHAEDLQHVSRIQTDNRKFNKFARQMKAGRGVR